MSHCAPRLSFRVQWWQSLTVLHCSLLSSQPIFAETRTGQLFPLEIGMQSLLRQCVADTKLQLLDILQNIFIAMHEYSPWKRSYNREGIGVLRGIIQQFLHCLHISIVVLHRCPQLIFFLYKKFANIYCLCISEKDTHFSLISYLADSETSQPESTQTDNE